MDTLKLMSQTNEEFLRLLEEVIKDPSPEAKNRYNNPDKILRTFAAFFGDILVMATSAAIFSYHKQLRAELKCKGIDIDDFIDPPTAEPLNPNQ